MGCVTVDLPNGGTAIVCGRGQRSVQGCVRCNRLATRLCDYKLSRTARGAIKLCSAPICARCTTRLPGDKDACPQHAQACLAACARVGLQVPGGA